ncbi:MAG: hypothetical protein QXY62_02140 [Candidatus Altiarchaeota archaeon]
MEYLSIALIAILGIAIVEAIYIIIKTQKRKIFESEHKPEEVFLKIELVDAIRFGFGFMLGALIFLLILLMIAYAMNFLRIPLPKLPF